MLVTERDDSEISPSPMIGETLGNYQIVSLIGKGGMGEVFLAEHALLGRKVAIKLLLPEMSRDAELVGRFFNEARTAATIHHPGLIELLDFGHHKDGRAYIVMQLLEGESLAARLARDGKLSLTSALLVARQMASALYAAHEKGIVHRDLKPENIFLVTDPDAPGGFRVKVLDFGVAKLVRTEKQRTVKTKTGSVLGTPRYMAPEQCKSSPDLDHRADVYALGCMLYEMVLGVAPFEYDNWGELVAAQIHETPAAPTDLDPMLSPAVEVLIMRALAKDAKKRYQTMADFARSIESVWKACTGKPRTMLTTPPMGTPVVPLPDALRDTGKKTVDPPSRASRPSMSDMWDQPTQLAAEQTAPLPVPVIPESAPAAALDARGSAAHLKTVEGSGGLDASKVSGSDQTQPDSATAAKHDAPPSKAWIWIVVGIATVGVVTIGIAAVSLLRGPKTSAATSEPTYVVVDQRDPTVAPRADAAQLSAPPVIDAPAAIPASPDAGTRVPNRKPTEPDSRQLTKAFGRQTAAVTACFRQNSDVVPDEIALRFHIDLDGKVVSAEIVPDTLSGTPLAKCLEGVAFSASFGPQAKPITFRVPIRAKAE